MGKLYQASSLDQRFQMVKEEKKGEVIGKLCGVGVEKTNEGCLRRAKETNLQGKYVFCR